MAKTNRNHNDDADDDVFTMNRIKSCDPDPWSDLNHDILFLVMMQLGVIDFIAFSGVCKSFALSNRNNFMMSKPPMSICISTDKKECYLYLEDFEGRKFKTLLPHSVDRTCIGVTCGYLILFCKKTRDFWLVNPITRHELHFPDIPIEALRMGYPADRAILVFSSSISGWVFVMLNRFDDKIWFCIDGKREWTYVYTACYIHDLIAFKGKIYFVDIDKYYYEVTLYPTRKVTSLKIKSFPKPRFKFPVFVSSGENLYVRELFSTIGTMIHEMNIDKMECVLREKAEEEYAFFCSDFNGIVILLLELWADLPSKVRRYAIGDESGKDMSFCADMWYFPHDCLNVNYIH